MVREISSTSIVKEGYEDVQRRLDVSHLNSHPTLSFPALYFLSVKWESQPLYPLKGLCGKFPWSGVRGLLYTSVLSHPT